MKKIAVALFAGLIILAIAAPLFAETYMDGMVFYRPRIYTNSDFISDNPDRGNVNDERILPILRLGAGYRAEDYAEAYFKLGTLGNGNSLGGSSWGGQQTAGGDAYHEFSIQEAWFDVRFPSTPVHWRVGRYGQSLGHGFYYNSGAYGGDGMKLWAPIGPVRVDLGYQKHNESNRFSKDIDHYFLQVGGAVAEKHQLSGAFTWFEGRSMNINSNSSSRDTYGTIDHIFTMWDPSVNFDSHIYTLGASADGQIIPEISYRAEAVYAFGDLTTGFKKTDLAKPETLNGFALMGGATVTLGPATVTFEAAYGSGDKRKKMNDWSDRRNLGSGSTFEGFRVPMAQWGRNVWFDEFSFYPGAADGDPFDFAGDGPGGGVDKKGRRTAHWIQRGLENLCYLTLGGSYTPITPVTLGIDAYYMWAVQATPKQGYDPDSRIYFAKQQGNTLGLNIDFTAKWVVNKNFSMIGAWSPWFPGDYFEVPKGSRYISDPANYDPNNSATYEDIPKSTSLEWGWIARVNCIFSH